jgi:hypothetical protein
MGGGNKKKGNILRIVLINSNYFTVGVKNEMNFNSFDACHSARHRGSCDSTISGSQVATCHPDE